MRAAARLGSGFLATDDGLVYLDNAAVAAHRGQADSLHREANAVRHEPRGLVGHLQHPVELVGAHALLG